MTVVRELIITVVGRVTVTVGELSVVVVLVVTITVVVSSEDDEPAT